MKSSGLYFCFLFLAGVGVVLGGGVCHSDRECGRSGYHCCKGTIWCCPNGYICTGSSTCINIGFIVSGAVVFVAVGIVVGCVIWRKKCRASNSE